MLYAIDNPSSPLIWSRQNFVRLSLPLMSAVISVICQHCDSLTHTALAPVAWWDLIKVCRLKLSSTGPLRSPSSSPSPHSVLIQSSFSPHQSSSNQYMLLSCHWGWGPDGEIDRHRKLLHQQREYVTINHKERLGLLFIIPRGVVSGLEVVQWNVVHVMSNLTSPETYIQTCVSSQRKCLQALA